MSANSYSANQSLSNKTRLPSLSSNDFLNFIQKADAIFKKDNDTEQFKTDYILAIKRRLHTILAQNNFNDVSTGGFDRIDRELLASLQIFPFKSLDLPVMCLPYFVLEQIENNMSSIFHSHIVTLQSWLTNPQAVEQVLAAEQKLAMEQKPPAKQNSAVKQDRAETKAESIRGQTLYANLDLVAEFSKKWDDSAKKTHVEIEHAKAVLDCYSTNDLYFFPQIFTQRKYAKTIERIKSQCTNSEIRNVKHLLGVLMSIDEENRNQKGHLQAIIAVIATKVFPELAVEPSKENPNADVGSFRYYQH